MLVGLRRWETAAKEKRGRGEERGKETASERKVERSTMAWAQCTECSIYLQSPAERYGYVQRCRRLREVGWAST